MSRMNLNSQKTRLAVIAVVLVAVLATAIAVLSGSSNNSDAETVSLSPGIIAPATYVSEFVDGGRDHFLLDVRTPEEFEEGHIAGAVNIPVQVLDQYLSLVPQDRDVVLYCRTGNRSQVAMEILNQAGYQNVFDIEGGTVAWTAQNRPLE